MAKFKCKHSGCIYEFTDEPTIKNMRAHAEYEEVSPTALVPPVAPQKSSVKKEKL